MSDSGRKNTVLVVDDSSENIDLLNKVMDTLNSYPGEDNVLLAVANSEHAVKMVELPPAGYCPELAKKISSILR